MVALFYEEGVVDAMEEVISGDGQHCVQSAGYIFNIDKGACQLCLKKAGKPGLRGSMVEC